jgi:hypothetical protein
MTGRAAQRPAHLRGTLVPKSSQRLVPDRNLCIKPSRLCTPHCLIARVGRSDRLNVETTRIYVSIV